MAQRRLSLVLDLDTGRYSGRLTQAGSQMRQFGGNVDKASASVRKFSDGFDRMGSRMSTPLQKLRDYVMILGNLRLAFLNVRDLAVGWVASLVMQSAKVERLTVLMKGMSQQMTEAGKTAEAKRNMGELFEMARKTGFAVEDLADSFVKFQSAKLNPRDGSLQALADAVAAFGGTSDVMHRASIAIQQMSGKGVISMEELRQQLGEAVPTAMSLMARSMRKTVAELSKEVATGTVKAGPALALMFAEMQRTYAGAGGKLAQTMSGQLAELRTNVTLLSTDFTSLDKKDGLFANSVTSMRELNALLKGTEGRAMMRGLGESINSIAMALVGAVKVAVEFRSEIGAAIKTVAIGVALLTAKRFGAWVRDGAMDAVASLRVMSAGFRQAGVEAQAYRAVLSGNVNSQNMWAIQNNAAAMQLASVRARIEQERTLIAVTQGTIATKREEMAAMDMEIAKIRALQAARGQDQVAVERGARAAVIASEVKIAAMQAELDQRLRANIQRDPQMGAARLQVQAAAAEEIAAIERVAAARAAADAAANNSTVSRSARANMVRTALRAQSVAEAELTQATNALATAEGRLRQVEQTLMTQRATARNRTAQEISLQNRLTIATNELTEAKRRETAASLGNTTVANQNARAGMAVLAVKQRQILVAAQLAAAQTAETAAVTRLTLAEAANTIGKRALAAATTLATGATRLLTGAMTLLLSPVVMIGVALYQAASAAGVFETKADRATAAAERMRQGIATLSDMEDAAARRRQIREQIEENKDVNPLWGITVKKGEGWWDTGLNLSSNGDRAKKRAELKAEDDKLAAQMKASAPQVAMDQSNKRWDNLMNARSAVMNRVSEAYGRQADKLAADLEKGDTSAKAKMDALDKRFALRRLNVDKTVLSSARKDLASAILNKRPQAELDALTDKVVKARELVTQGQSAITAGAASMNAALGSGAKGLDKWGRAAVSADGAAAAAAAKMNGTGAAIAKFNAELAGGKFIGASEDQIARIRRAAVATDALAMSKKSAGQDDGFESRLVSMAGRLAQLQDRLEDGAGELAKFNAQLEASPDKLGLTPQQIERLRDLAQGIDETKHAQDIKRLMDDLAGDFKNATTEGDALWASFARGTMDADEKLAQLKGRFAEKLVGKTGEDLANAQAQIDKIVAAMTRADAAQTVRGWQDSADQMRIALMDEDAQREANFQRELRRQQLLLDAIRINAQMSAEEKRHAEEQFLAWKTAAEARDKRASEGQLAAQARQWANLGQNIQGTMAQALGSIVEGMMDANANFGDLVADILKKIVTIILQAMIAYAILSAIGMANNSSGQPVSMGQFLKGQMGSGFSLGGGGNSATNIGYGSSGAATVAKNHNGGMVGNMAMRATVPQSVFKDAQTRHNGGWIGGRQLKPGEVPLIGLDDEVILNREQQKLLGKGLGGSGGGATSVQVNVINNSGTELETEHGEPEFNGKEMIVNVVVEAAQRQGKLRDVFTQLAGN